jgi:predicted RNA-binding protein YlqC (UPF0109 family)
MDLPGAVRWLEVYCMVELECDTPILEALIWSCMWAGLERIGTSLTVPTQTTYNYERNLARLVDYDLIVDYEDEQKVIARWDSTTQTLRTLTQYDRALAQALGYSLNPPQCDALVILMAGSPEPMTV